MSTLLEEIAKRIKEHDDDFKREKAKKRPKPFTLEEYEVPEFVIPKTRDKKQIGEFRKILTFIKKKAQYLREKNKCTIMPIPSTSKDLKKIWSNVSRGRGLMLKIGLIDIYCEDYRSRGKITYAKLYKYFYENEVKFVEYCRENNITVLDLELKEEIEEAEIEEAEDNKTEIDKSKVKIGKGLYLNKPHDLSCTEFEKYLFEVFKKNYPEYDKYKAMVDEINKHYDKTPEFAIRFEPSFQWNKKKTRVMKIGFRATNQKCNEKKENRQEILDKNDLVLDADVNGSVPRLNLSMNLGHWYDEERDMYEVIFHNCYPNEEFTKEAREAMKQLLLRGYFEYSVGTLGRDIWSYINHKGLKEKETKKELKLLDNGIRKACGPIIYGSEIYYIEGCVYLSVIKDILDSGHFAWFLYDGIYASGPNINEMFRSLVKRMIKVRFDQFYKEYISNRYIK